MHTCACRYKRVLGTTDTHTHTHARYVLNEVLIVVSVLHSSVHACMHACMHVSMMLYVFAYARVGIHLPRVCVGPGMLLPPYLQEQEVFSALSSEAQTTSNTKCVNSDRSLRTLGRRCFGCEHEA